MPKAPIPSNEEERLAELTESEERFRSTFEQAAVGIAHVSPEGRFLRINQKFCDIVGYSREEMLQRTLQEITYPDDLHADIEQANQLLSGEIDTYSMEKRYIRKNGELVWIQLTVSLVRNKARQPRWFVAVVKDINERKQAEEALQTSELQYRTTLDSMGDAIHVVDKDLRIVLYNPTLEQWCSQLGLESKPVGMTIFEAFPFLSEKVRDEYHRVFQTGETLVREETNTIGNKEFKVEARKIPILDKGKVAQIVTVIRDITDRKRAEDALRESEKRFRDIADNALEWIWEVDSNGKYTYVSPVVERVLGYKPEEVLQKHFYDLFCPDDKEELKRAAFEAFAGKEGFREFINRNVHKNGKVVWLSTSGIPIIDKRGELVGYRGADIDITERKQAEEALRESEAILNAAQAVAHVGSWRLDTSNDILLWSDETYRIFDIPVGTPLTYSKFLECVHPDDRKYVEARWNAAFQGEPYDIEHRIVAGDKVKWVREKAAITFDENGRAARGIGTVQDITEQKQDEKTLLEYQQRLKALASELTIAEERERRRIAAELHDGIAQSLAFARIQITSAGKAASETKLADQLDEVSQSLREAIESIQDIVLDLSSPSMNEIGLAAALSEWLEGHIEKRHGITTEFVDECGQIVLDDDVQAVLFRNVRELGANVVRHAKASRIAVQMSCPGDSLQIIVEDDGLGFDPDAGYGAVGRGGGFGLFSIRERMAELGGSLEIVSEPGKGCRAVLTIPQGRGKLVDG